MLEVEVRDEEPWYRSRRGPSSSHLQVWCGDAYLLVQKSDGLTQIGYQDEETYLPTATNDQVVNWVTIFQWRAQQTFPWIDHA